MREAPRNDEPDGHRSGFSVHADAVVIGETGILIRGPSGAGKSRLVLTLTVMAETSGYFARLVGDDRIYLEQSGGRLVARGHPSIQGAIEWRGQGIFRTGFLDSAVVGLVVDLVSSREVALLRYPEEGECEVTLAGVKLPAMNVRNDLGPSDQASYIMQHFRLHREGNLDATAAAGTFA